MATMVRIGGAVCLLLVACGSSSSPSAPAVDGGEPASSSSGGTSTSSSSGGTSTSSSSSSGGGPVDAGPDAGDAGGPYFTLRPKIEGVDFNAVAGFDATHVWAVGTAGKVYFWDGVTWSLLRSGAETWNAVRAVDTQRVYVAGDAGARGCSFDGGKTWSITTSPTGASFRAMRAVAATNEVDVAGTDGVVERTTLDCAAWNVHVKLGAGKDLNAAFTADRYQTLAVGAKGIVFTNWSTSFSFSDTTVYTAVWTGRYLTSNGPPRVVLGASGTGLHSIGENEWRSTSFSGQPTPTRINAIWGLSETRLVAVGEPSATATGNTGGFTAIPNPLTTPTALRGVWGSSDDDVWVVGAAGTILHHP